MRNPRFKAYLIDLLKNSNTPGVVSVETVPHQGVDLIRVTLDDNGDRLVVDLLVTNTAPPGGDAHNTPEKIVTKEDVHT